MKIYLYSETGFNDEDRPENLDLLDDANLVAEFDNYNIVQTENLAEVVVDNLTEEEARSVDYVIIERNKDVRTGYIKSGFKFETETGVCSFYLIEDEWATVGGFKVGSGNEIIYATADRICVSDDDETYYTEVEPFKPSERCHIIEGIYGNALDPSMSEQLVNILETVVSPPKLVEAIWDKKPNWESDNILAVDTAVEIYTKDNKRIPIANASNATYCQEGTSIGEQVSLVKDEETGQVFDISKSVLITPQFRDIQDTIYIIGKLFAGNVTLKTGSRWWNGDNMKATYIDKNHEVHHCSVMRDLRIAGSENAATAFWSVPSNYIESMSDGGYSARGDYAGGISQIKSKVLNATAIFTTTHLQYKNNKIYYGQALVLKVFSPISGEQIEKQAWEIRNPDITPNIRESRADYSIGADIRSGGSPIFAWKYINGEDQTDSYAETIKGGKWRQIPLAATGAYDPELKRQYDSSSMFKEGLKDWGQTALSVGAIAGGIGLGIENPLTGGSLIKTGVDGLVDEASNGFQKFRKSREALKRKLDAQGAVASVPLNISNSDYLREIGRNSFYNIFQLYTEEDIKAFDRFLTLYGYKVNNKVINANDFYSRPSFNFVKINEMGIKSTKHPSSRINSLIADLKAGLRIWHEIPNQQAIESGNKEVA